MIVSPFCVFITFVVSYEVKGCLIPVFIQAINQPFSMLFRHRFGYLIQVVRVRDEVRRLLVLHILYILLRVRDE